MVVVVVVGERDEEEGADQAIRDCSDGGEERDASQEVC